MICLQEKQLNALASDSDYHSIFDLFPALHRKVFELQIANIDAPLYVKYNGIEREIPQFQGQFFWDMPYKDKERPYKLEGLQIKAASGSTIQLNCIC